MGVGEDRRSNQEERVMGGGGGGGWSGGGVSDKLFSLNRFSVHKTGLLS